MNDGDSELARLQAALLDCLDLDQSSEALTRLREIETEAHYQAWIDSFDPHMAQLAGELVRKWGRRRED
jgi:hypothetical protein